MKQDLQQYAAEQLQRCASLDVDAQTMEAKLRRFNDQLSRCAQAHRASM
jgi:hypothetical protein